MRQKTSTDLVESSPSFGIELLHSFLCHRSIKADILDMSSIIVLYKNLCFLVFQKPNTLCRGFRVDCKNGARGLLSVQNLLHGVAELADIDFGRYGAT